MVYIAGSLPGRYDNKSGWRRDVTILLSRMDCHVVNAEIPERGTDTQKIVKRNKILINSSELIFANVSDPRWSTAMELSYAKLKKKHIICYFNTPKSMYVNPWIRFYSNAVFHSLGDAVNYVKKYTKEVLK